MRCLVSVVVDGMFDFVVNTKDMLATCDVKPYKTLLKELSFIELSACQSRFLDANCPLEAQQLCLVAFASLVFTSLACRYTIAKPGEFLFSMRIMGY